MKVVIIGSGNVATVLGKKIQAAGHEIIEVAGRNTEKVRQLASVLGARYTSNLLEINTEGEMYLISVSDSAIESVARQLKLNDKLVVHTAAGVSKDVLDSTSTSYGVLYPLQTFRGELSSLPVVPVLIDANSNSNLSTLSEFAATWAESVSIGTDEQRLMVHLAAVFVNNFTNHLFALATDVFSSNQFNFNILQPLIEETIARMEKFSAAEVQTGPAVRNDLVTIEKHRQLLTGKKELLKVYNCLTDSIVNYYSENKR